MNDRERFLAVMSYRPVDRGVFGVWTGGWPETYERWRREGRMEVVNARTGQVLPIGTALLDDLEAHGAASLNVLAAAARVRVPWLIAHGTADESVASGEAEVLAGASGSVRTKLLIVEGAGHTFGVRHPWAGSTSELDQVIKATAKFLSGTLG